MGRLPTCALVLLAGFVSLLATPATALAAPSGVIVPARSSLGAEPMAAHDLVGAPGAPGAGPDVAVLAGSPTVEHPVAEHRRPLPHRASAAAGVRPTRRPALATGPARRLPGRPAGLAAPLRRGPPAPARA